MNRRCWSFRVVLHSKFLDRPGISGSSTAHGLQKMRSPDFDQHGRHLLLCDVQTVKLSEAEMLDSTEAESRELLAS